MRGVPLPVLCGILVLVTGCAARQGVPPYAGAEPDSELLREVRELTREEGLVAARERLVAGLEERDGSGGELGRRVAATTRDPGLVLPDSIAALPPSHRGRIGIAMVPGTRAGNTNKGDRTRECLRGAAEAARGMGFPTWFVETQSRGSGEENAECIARSMAEVFESSDTVVIVMLSKGAHDVVRYLREEGVRLPPEQRNKLGLVFSLAGTVQGSVVADWMAHSPRPLPRATRKWLRLSGQEGAVGMVEEVARSPWQDGDAGRVAAAFPRLNWVSIAMVPDGEDARITERLWSPWVRARVERTMPYYSPSDGLLETAASILPDGMDVPQWIVYGYGSHALPNGRYADGGGIAPTTTKPGREKLRKESGGEIMSAYLRALPRSLLR